MWRRWKARGPAVKQTRLTGRPAIPDGRLRCQPRGRAIGTSIVAITRDDVRRVAALARLRLEPAEEERLTTDLDHILEAFVLLQRLDTSAVPPMAHVDDFGARLRADEVLNPAADEPLLANAPARDGRLFRVPRIIE
jgi:aspartyl-tRNA(Asn)/glutamyl-tRNA(Gln) amidotransferase subunit C